ncbi:MAG: TM1802 family CRISPR-associated protein [Candidatus Cellulosilyticum pullistercoris]|uniref:TM1802 family CRISPR-associated protein n=1 Tax=Candidatus Cellulosilyticum pullistercoris TaxID=2838521 RepID=A0A9E2KAV7_9FIRM|nr:TM1802 family CRISPR-associated protein [Candidatus Cellulosilyticum pullistercoris]
MQEYRCSSCGYRKVERDMIDVMGQVPMYPGFAAGFMPNFSNYMDWKEDPVCPNCGKASSWKTIINNNN